eukprot:10861630-Lingulodinium_polyedra.AAC.1
MRQELDKHFFKPQVAEDSDPSSGEDVLSEDDTPDDKKEGVFELLEKQRKFWLQGLEETLVFFQVDLLG